MQAESLDALLDLLGDGPETAGTAYRRLHLRLVRFFQINGRLDPEALADEVMNRLANIAADSTRDIDSPAAFAVGIARHVLQEDLRHHARDTETGREWERGRRHVDATEESTLQALDTCLDSMPASKRKLLRTYYMWTGEQKIAHHRQLAAELSLTINALRNRLMRARKELDSCVQQRLRDVSRINRTSRREEEGTNNRR